MTISNAIVGALLGTTEGTGVTIANNATTTGSEVDLFAGTTFLGEVALFLSFTTTGTAGSLDIKFVEARVTGQDYTDLAPILYSVPITAAGSFKVKLSSPFARIQSTRYALGVVTNNATAVNATNVFLGYQINLLS